MPDAPMQLLTRHNIGANCNKIIDSNATNFSYYELVVSGTHCVWVSGIIEHMGSVHLNDLIYTK